MSVNLKLFNSYAFLCAFHVLQFHKQRPDIINVISLFSFPMERGKMYFITGPELLIYTLSGYRNFISWMLHV